MKNNLYCISHIPHFLFLSFFLFLSINKTSLSDRVALKKEWFWLSSLGNGATKRTKINFFYNQITHLYIIKIWHREIHCLEFCGMKYIFIVRVTLLKILLIKIIRKWETKYHYINKRKPKIKYILSTHLACRK